MRLVGKVSVITGGARGIGKSTAEKFLKEGAIVVICDVNIDQVNETIVELKSPGSEIYGYKVDVTNREEINVMVNEVRERFGKIDCLINNAGITADNTLLKLSEDEWDRVININLKGVFNCGQAVARIMGDQGFGVILNATSVVGLYGNFGQSNYAAAKWGVIGMTKTWSKELGKKGIRVNAVAPGFIVTPMTEKMPEKVLDMMKEKASVKRLGYPEDIANAYAFLASDEASFITGTVLSVDGGVVL